MIRLKSVRKSICFAFFRSLVIYDMRDPCHLAGLFAGQSAELFITCHLWFPGGCIDFSAVAPLAFPSVVIELEHGGICLFLPGHPSLCLTMIAMSLGISVFQRMLSRESQFIHVPQLILPLLCLVVVAVVTAKLTGLGLRTFGSDVYGGKKYVYLLGAILGYFALSARRIPPGREIFILRCFFSRHIGVYRRPAPVAAPLVIFHLLVFPTQRIFLHNRRSW